MMESDNERKLPLDSEEDETPCIEGKTIMTHDETPRAWVGSLSAYNAGTLLGDWFDAPDIPTDAVEWAKRLTLTFGEQFTLTGSKLNPAEHEELWVFDHENFGGLIPNECSPVHARDLAQLLADASDDGVDAAALAAYVDNLGLDLEGKEWADIADEFTDAFVGEFGSEREFADEEADVLLDDSAISSTVAQYFDYAAFARDLFISDYLSTRAPGGNVYVFRNV